MICLGIDHEYIVIVALTLDVEYFNCTCMNITYMFLVISIVARGDLSTPPSTAFTCATTGIPILRVAQLDHLAFFYSYIHFR